MTQESGKARPEPLEISTPARKFQTRLSLALRSRTALAMRAAGRARGLKEAGKGEKGPFDAPKEP